MKVGVCIFVEDWDGDDVVYVSRTERASAPGDTEPEGRVSKLLAELIDECSLRAGQQAMALAEDVAERAEGS